MKRWLMPAAVCLVLTAASSAPPVRRLLTAPLVVSDESASGDAAYVLAGGREIRERLDAAADLYHLQRVPLIIVMRDGRTGPYNFTARASWTATHWTLDYLRWLGVPEDKTLVFDSRTTSRFGTLDEARSLALALPASVTRLVLVTSPPHTRRSMLAFRRSLPARVVLTSYSAASVDQSTEYYRPLWLEYVKLLVYSIVA